MKTVKVLFLFCLCTILFSERICSQNKTQFSFPEITKMSKPWTYWWWLGSAVDSQNITYNLEKFAEAGIGGVHIIPIYGVRGYEEKFIDFLSPKWMKMLEYTSKECERLEIGLDMTLGTGWPFGGPNVPAKYSSSQMIDVSFDAKNKAEIRLNIIEEAKKKKNENCEMKILSANAYSKIGKTDLLKYIDEKDLLVWKPICDSCKIIALVTVSPIQQVKRAAPGGKGNVVDPFSTEAVQDYLASFDKAFENYKRKIPEAFYHDSYEYFDADWTKNILSEFEKRRGYNFLDQIPAFLGSGNSEIVSRVKSDYRFTISQLHEEFIKTVSAWSNKKNAAFRNQAHGAPGNLLDIYAAADIPETEVFGTPRLDINGLSRDTLFMREEYVDPLILKFASSAAHTTGKNLISSETGTWLAEHFRESLSQIRPEIDLLLLSGVNHIYFHGIPYSPKEEEWPGWQFYASTNYGPTNSLWRDIPFLNNYIARCQSVLQEGKPDNELLIYFPIWDIWHSPKERLINLRIHNPEQWLLETNFYRTVKELADKGYSFDYVSDEQIEKSKIVNCEILTGLNKYKAIVVPSVKYMPVQTLQKLNEFVKNGGKIIFMDKLPEDVPGFYKYEEQREKLKRIEKQIANNSKAKNKKVLIGKDLPAMLDEFGISRENLSDFKIDFIRRKFDSGRYYFIANQQSKKISDWVRLASQAESIIILDPLNGKTGLAKTKKENDGSTSVYLQIESGASLILKCLDKKIGYEQWTYLQESERAYKIKGEWDIEFIQGGPVLPVSMKINNLESWTNFGDKETKRFLGTARYKIKFPNPEPECKNWIVDFGKVCESVRVKINGRDLGALWSIPFRMSFGDILFKGENELEVEVTNLSANRIKDLDERGVNWKKFYDINFVNMNYKKFDASTWNLVDSGLLGPVKLISVGEIK
jgi:hypothetical protein